MFYFCFNIREQEIFKFINIKVRRAIKGNKPDYITSTIFKYINNLSKKKQKLKINSRIKAFQVFQNFLTNFSKFLFDTTYYLSIKPNSQQFKVKYHEIINILGFYLDNFKIDDFFEKLLINRKKNEKSIENLMSLVKIINNFNDSDSLLSFLYLPLSAMNFIESNKKNLNELKTYILISIFTSINYISMEDFYGYSSFKFINNLMSEVAKNISLYDLDILCSIAIQVQYFRIKDIDKCINNMNKQINLLKILCNNTANPQNNIQVYKEFSELYEYILTYKSSGNVNYLNEILYGKSSSHLLRLMNSFMNDTINASDYNNQVRIKKFLNTTTQLNNKFNDLNNTIFFAQEFSSNIISIITTSGMLDIWSVLSLILYCIFATIDEDLDHVYSYYNGLFLAMSLYFDILKKNEK
jgi:hypothetical protein